jgi:uncharacterized membrane protein
MKTPEWLDELLDARYPWRLRLLVLKERLGVWFLVAIGIIIFLLSLPWLVEHGL